jgi:hypothetical protein
LVLLTKTTKSGEEEEEENYEGAIGPFCLPAPGPFLFRKFPTPKLTMVVGSNLASALLVTEMVVRSIGDQIWIETTRHKLSERVYGAF